MRLTQTLSIVVVEQPRIGLASRVDGNRGVEVLTVGGARRPRACLDGTDGGGPRRVALRNGFARRGRRRRHCASLLAGYSIAMRNRGTTPNGGCRRRGMGLVESTRREHQHSREWIRTNLVPYATSDCALVSAWMVSGETRGDGEHAVVTEIEVCLPNKAERRRGHWRR